MIPMANFFYYFLVIIKLVAAQDLTGNGLITNITVTIPVPTQVSISSELVDIVVKNITKVTAQLEWQFSAEVTSVLKAIRVNCTTVRSLVEPFEIFPPVVLLHNPSALGSQITLQNLDPATEYSCNLIGALSLEIGAEQLAVLSNPAVFSTLIERPSMNFKFGYGQSTLTIILGGGIPAIVIIIAIIIMIIGYCKYRKSKKPKKDKEGKYVKYIPEHLPRPGDSPQPGDPPSKRPPSQSRRKERRKHDDVDDDKKQRKSHRESKSRRKITEQPSLTSNKSSKGKRPPKKQAKLHTLSENYVYNMVPNSSSSASEDEHQNRHNQTRLRDFGNELGWDPHLLHNHNKVPHGLQEPIKPRSLESKNLSSPGVNNNKRWEEQPFSPQAQPANHDVYKQVKGDPSFYY